MNNDAISKNTADTSNRDPLWNIWYEVGVLAISGTLSEAEAFIEELGKMENIELQSMISADMLRRMKFGMLRKREIYPCARNPIAEKMWKEVDKPDIQYDYENGSMTCEFPDLNLDGVV